MHGAQGFQRKRGRVLKAYVAGANSKIKTIFLDQVFIGRNKIVIIEVQKGSWALLLREMKRDRLSPISSMVYSISQTSNYSDLPLRFPST